VGASHKRAIEVRAIEVRYGGARHLTKAPTAAAKASPVDIPAGESAMEVPGT
jgi:hypothetical protein